MYAHGIPLGVTKIDGIHRVLRDHCMYSHNTPDCGGVESIWLLFEDVALAHDATAAAIPQQQTITSISTE